MLRRQQCFLAPVGRRCRAVARRSSAGIWRTLLCGHLSIGKFIEGITHPTCPKDVLRNMKINGIQFFFNVCCCRYMSLAGWIMDYTPPDPGKLIPTASGRRCLFKTNFGTAIHCGFRVRRPGHILSLDFSYKFSMINEVYFESMS